MGNVLLGFGRIVGIAGALLTAFAAIERLMGVTSAGGFQVVTLLQGGTAAMVMACLAYSAASAEARR